jgi:hypothetical protein
VVLSNGGAGTGEVGTNEAQALNVESMQHAKARKRPLHSVIERIAAPFLLE